jgi:PTS system N-acetylgalactosamine-specific IIA component
VVAGHGEFAAGLISAVQQISGAGHVFQGISNGSLGASELDAALHEAVVTTRATVVFTDLPAGSCTISARRIGRELTNLVVVTGTNLPMLLDFALKGADGARSLDRVAEKGRSAIAVMPSADERDGERAD